MKVDINTHSRPSGSTRILQVRDLLLFANKKKTTMFKTMTFNGKVSNAIGGFYRASRSRLKTCYSIESHDRINHIDWMVKDLTNDYSLPTTRDKIRLDLPMQPELLKEGDRIYFVLIAVHPDEYSSHKGMTGLNFIHYLSETVSVYSIELYEKILDIPVVVWYDIDIGRIAERISYNGYIE